MNAPSAPEAALAELAYCEHQAARRDLTLRQRASYRTSASAARERIAIMAADVAPGERNHGKIRYWFGATGNDKTKGCRCPICVAAKDAPLVVLR